MQFITPEESRTILGDQATVLKGTSFIFWDPKQFMTVSWLIGVLPMLSQTVIV
jgi:hypothetical protein